MQEKIARIISNILHPYLTGIIFFLSLYFLNHNLSLKQFLFIFLTDILTPLSFILILMSYHKVSDIDISDVTKRKYFYFPAFFILLITFPLFFYFKIPKFLIFIQIGLLFWVFSWAIISLFYKISGHVGGASLIYTIIVFFINKNFLPLYLLLPILAWSRIRLKKHTIDQTITGGVLGFLIGLIVFKLF